jgi:pimeloyl-ACP methyl ester carboxylesterase
MTHPERERRRRRWLVAGGVVLALTAAPGDAAAPGNAQVAAPAPAIWGSLAPGPYPVGYRSLYLSDPTRPWSALTLARPVRVHLWYPAAAADGNRMTFGEYLNWPAPAVWEGVERRLRAYDRGADGGGLAGLVGTAERVESLLGQPMAASAEATAAAGRFPLGQNNYTQENLVLWEYLASQGYVVVTVPHLGTSPRRFHLWIHEPLSFEAQLRDLEAAYSWALDLEMVDPRRLFAAGHSMGGTYALLLAMRNPRFRGVIGLDASLLAAGRAAWILDETALPYWNPDAVEVPVLELFKSRGEHSLERLESLRYADRYLVELTDFTHGDFQSAPLYRRAVGVEGDAADLAVRAEEVGVSGFEEVCRMLRDFLSWAGLEPIAEPWDPSLERRGLAGSVERRTPVQGPSAEELYSVLAERGAGAARAQVLRSLERNPRRQVLTPDRMRILGNELLWGGEAELAVEIGRLWTLAAPTTTDAHLLLAEALEEVGAHEEARRELRRVLELDPDHEEARRILEQG